MHKVKSSHDDTVWYTPGSIPAQALTPLQSAFDAFQSPLLHDKLVLKYGIFHLY